MSRDDIFKMAREAGFSGYDSQSECLTHFFKLAYEAGAKDERERLISEGWRQCAQGQKTTQFCGMVEQARAEEREACAQICDEHDDLRYANKADLCATAIRARGNT